MIEIKITTLETCDKPMLLALAEMFQKLAGSCLPLPTGLIEPEDSPAAGSPTVSDAAQTFAAVEAVNPATAFAPTVTSNDAAQAFGTPSPNAQSVSEQGDARALVPVTNLAPQSSEHAVSAALIPPPPPFNPANAPVGTATNTSHSNVMLDADGLPWDARIHSSARSQNADGRWKKKRGVDDSIVKIIESELRGVMAIPTGAVPPPPPPMGVTMPVVQGQPAPTLAPAAVAPFPALLMKITARGLDMAKVTSILAPLGIPSLPVLATRPDLIPQVDAAIDGIAS